MVFYWGKIGKLSCWTCLVDFSNLVAQFLCWYWNLAELGSMLIDISGIISKISHCGVDLIDSIIIHDLLFHPCYPVFLDSDCLVAHILWALFALELISVVRFGISVDDNDNIKPGRITMKPGPKLSSQYMNASHRWFHHREANYGTERFGQRMSGAELLLLSFWVVFQEIYSSRGNDWSWLVVQWFKLLANGKVLWQETSKELRIFLNFGS